MGRKAFVALSVCLLALGLAAFVFGDGDMGHAEPTLVGSAGFPMSALVSATSYDFGVVAVYNDGHVSAMSIPATYTTH